jgi:integrase
MQRTHHPQAETFYFTFIMEDRVMSSRSKEKRHRIRYTSDKGKRGEFTLRSDTDKAVVAEFKSVVDALVAYLRDGIPLTKRDRQRLENLPSGLQEKLVAHCLWEGEPVITLAQLIEYDKERRSHNKNVEESRVGRIHRYLPECFPPEKPIHTFVAEDGEKFRRYLLVERVEGRGVLTKESANMFIRELKTVFGAAVQKQWLTKSPFEDVEVGEVVSKSREHFVEDEQNQALVDACRHPELKFIVMIAHYTGLRWCDLADLKFSDFKFYPNGTGLFRVPDSGKTGTRKVPFPSPVRPYYDSVCSAAAPDQEGVFAKYRNYQQVCQAIKRDAKRAGLTLWPKFFTNLRSSCQTRASWNGCSDTVMDAMFGNSPKVRKKHYIQDRPDEAYAALGDFLSGKHGSEKAPPDFPPFPPETDDPAELRKWAEAVVEKTICRPLGVNMSGKDMIDGWESSHDCEQAIGEINSMWVYVGNDFRLFQR